MATDAAEVVVGANGHVFVGPTTATPPVDATTVLDATWSDELGFTSEDGATVTDSKDVTNIGAWQSLFPIRRIITGREFTIAFALRQWNADTVTFAFGGGTVSVNGDEFEYNPPDPEDLDERSLVLDWVDGTKHYRLYVPRGIVSENVETTLARSDPADLPITFAALQLDVNTPVYTLFTDDPAFAAGS